MANARLFNAAKRLGRRLNLFSSTRLFDLPLQAPRLQRKLFIPGLEEERIQAAAVLNGTQRVGTDAKPHAAAKAIAQKRDIAKVRQKTPLGLNIRVAYEMANKTTLACEIALARHDQT
jgi:hypothetical protein